MIKIFYCFCKHTMLPLKTEISNLINKFELFFNIDQQILELHLIHFLITVSIRFSYIGIIMPDCEIIKRQLYDVQDRYFFRK